MFLTPEYDVLGKQVLESFSKCLLFWTGLFFLFIFGTLTWILSSIIKLTEDWERSRVPKILCSTTALLDASIFCASVLCSVAYAAAEAEEKQALGSSFRALVGPAHCFCRLNKCFVDDIIITASIYNAHIVCFEASGTYFRNCTWVRFIK
jgi:hypothetical protein